MPPNVTVTTGARLHFGPLSVGGSGIRKFGGLGVMVDRPGFRIEFSPQDADGICAEQRAGRVRHCLEVCRRILPIPACRIELTGAPPEHAGFGAGTQLALGVAAGLFSLCGKPVPTAIELAGIVGRGRRSAIGIHGFDRGGLIIDAGQSADDQVGALSCHVPLPESWRFLLLTPTEKTGLSGESERAAFDRLPPMPSATTDRLCRLVLTELLPAAHSGNSTAFGATMTEYGELVGRFFATEQGGVYSHPQAGIIIEQLGELGVRGIAQTSWGPTLCALVESEEQARSIADALNASVTSNHTIRIAAPLNHGAIVEPATHHV